MASLREDETALSVTYSPSVPEPSPLLARLLRGLVAQGYFHVTTTVLQLLMVPVLLHSWGQTGYAAWLTLSALPAYLAVADLGFSQIAANEMTIKVAAGDHAGALVVFQSSLAMVTRIILWVLGLSFIAIAVLPFHEWLDLRHSQLTTQVVLVLMCAQVVVSLFFGVLGAGYRAEGQFAIAVSIVATARLVEGVAVIAVAVAGEGMIVAALIMLLSRVLVAAYGIIRLRRVAPWLSLGRHVASRDVARRLLIPSMSFMGFNIGSMLGIQGTTIVLSSTLGPAAVVAVSTTRTLSRLGPTAASMVHYALQQEYSTYFGASAFTRFWRLFRRHLIVVVALTGLYLALGLPLGGWALHAWTRGKVDVSSSLLPLMMIGCAIEMMWMVPQTPIVSVNRHKLAGTSYLVLNAVAIGALALFAGRWGVECVGWVYVVIGLIMAALCTARLKLLSREVLQTL